LRVVLAYSAQRNKARWASASWGSSLFMLSGCGGGGGSATTPNITYTQTSAYQTFSASGDAFIDGLTFGTKFSNSKIGVAVSGGLNGEYWLDPENVGNYFDTLVANTLQYTNLDFEYLGSFEDPSEAAKNGADITLIPYVTNEYNVPYRVAGFAYPVGFKDISEASSLPVSYSGQDGDIFINFGGLLGDVDLSYAPGAEGYLIVMHELGHSLGLKHPHDNIGVRLNFSQYAIAQYDLDEYTMMSYNDDSNSYVEYDPATPMVLDVIGLQHLYGKNQTLNSGDTNHQIDHSGIYSTIWDPSGSNTVDASQSTWDWYVELPSIISSPENGEFVGVALTANNSAAPTDLIWLIGDFENLLGGHGDDILVGNHLDNLILGGGGDDLIYGMGGNNTLNGGAGSDFFIISKESGHNLIQDFDLNFDSWSIIDGNGDDASYERYSVSYDNDGDLIYVWENQVSLTFEGIKESDNSLSRYLFTEEDNADPSDYDYVIWDKAEGNFSIHIEDYDYFNLLHADFADGSSRSKFAIYFSNVNSEDPAYVAPAFETYDWQDAEAITVNNGSGLQKFVTVSDEYLKNINLDDNFDYMGFLVLSDSYYVGDEFLISEVIV